MFNCRRRHRCRGRSRHKTPWTPPKTEVSSHIVAYQSSINNSKFTTTWAKRNGEPKKPKKNEKCTPTDIEVNLFVSHVATSLNRRENCVTIRVCSIWRDISNELTLNRADVLARVRHTIAIGHTHTQNLWYLCASDHNHLIVVSCECQWSKT